MMVTEEIFESKREAEPVLQLINDEVVNSNSIELYVKREDLIHNYISGNKWRKLKYNIIEASGRGIQTLLTFGGAYSNHIHATAAAGRIFNFETIGVIRGEEYHELNPTLNSAVGQGMKLFYINRQDYRNKYDKRITDLLYNKFGEFYLIPEGGTNKFALKGCREICDDIKIECDLIATACGTAGTVSGIILGSKSPVMGFSILNASGFIENQVNQLISQEDFHISCNWQIIEDYHFGGYAKINSDLVKFVDWFKERNNIQLDYIYNGKMLYGLYDMIKKKYFKPGTRIIAIHTGGLQGNMGMKNKIDKIKEKQIDQ